MKVQSLFILFISLTILSVPTFAADSWALPEKRTVCSKNGKFCVEIIPKKLESQLSYFEDKIEGKQDAGADKTKKKKNYCRAIFFARQLNGNKKRMWETRLVNEVAPVSALVSEAGDYVIAFDNWHSVGYGDDVVAIYRGSDGSLVRKFGLSEFLTESDIGVLPRSVSSIHWGRAHWIDATSGQLVLEVTRPGFASSQQDYFPIRVDLESGKILDEKRNRLPSLQFIIQATDTEVAGAAPTVLTEAKECFDGTSGDSVSSSTLLQRATKTETPPYPPAAVAVRAVGKITAQVLVRADGTVSCVRAVSGHPLLRATVVNALKKWSFQEADRAYSGFITLEGRVAVVGPDGKIIEGK